MCKKIVSTLFLLFTCTSTLTVMAHSGHGHNGDSSNIIHYLTEPIHFMVGLAGLIAIGVGIYSLMQRPKRQHKSK